jgi:hypothetical protein
MEEIRICAFFDVLGTREIMMGSDLFMRHALIDLIRKIEERSSCSLVALRIMRGLLGLPWRDE